MSQLDIFDNPSDRSTAAPAVPMDHRFSHARYSANGYELSSHGDKRFSALFCRLRDGRTIEEAYQLDVKGYRSVSNDWRAGKGKPALDGRSHEALWDSYLDLWRTWSRENPDLIENLRERAQGKVLTDKFASSPISQARALAQILNESAVATAAAAPVRRPGPRP